MNPPPVVLTMIVEETGMDRPVLYLVPIHKWRPLKNDRFCAKSRKAKIITAGILTICLPVPSGRQAGAGWVQKWWLFKGLGRSLIVVPVILSPVV